MFNWFGKSSYHNSYAPLPPPTQMLTPIVTPEDGFTIGVDNSGMTTLKISCSGTVTTITMPRDKTRMMIKLLQATLDDSPESE